MLGGLLLELMPLGPGIQRTSELVFLLFLPPLVFRAAFTTSTRDFRRLLLSILSLAVGLVLTTARQGGPFAHLFGDTRLADTCVPT